MLGTLQHEQDELTYDKELHKGLSKSFNNMVDLHVQLVGAEKRSPAGENGVCYFENANIDLRICCGESTDESLYDDQQITKMGENKLGEVKRHTRVNVSHFLQKSESAMMLIASPSCV